MSLSRQQVEHVALLARLQLTEDELETMTAQLGQILDYIESLQELQTEDVEPLAHPLELTNVFRDDQVHDTLLREEALRNAPATDGEHFLVPAVLGDSSPQSRR